MHLYLPSFLVFLSHRNDAIPLRPAHLRTLYSSKCLEGKFSEVRRHGVLGSLARRCPAKLAEHVSDGPRRTLPTRATFGGCFSTRPALLSKTTPLKEAVSGQGSVARTVPRSMRSAQPGPTERRPINPTRREPRP